MNCLLENRGKVAIITINRPPMNALSSDTLVEMDTMLSGIKEDTSICSVIITGAGEKMFSAGADITEFGDYANREQSIRRVHDFFYSIEFFPKPIIACVNGKALGGGNELQMACHLTIASENAEFGLPEVRLGIIPGYGGTQRLPRLIGKRRALELLLSGERISAAKALEYGLVNRVVSQESLLFEAMTWAEGFADGPPLAIQGILDSVQRGEAVTLQEGLSIELENMLKVSRSEDAIEGVTAFFSKRKAEFKGR
jgi:enoyl-CoA hydratase